MQAAKEVFGVSSNSAYRIASFQNFDHVAKGEGSKVIRAAAVFAELAPRVHDHWQELASQLDSEAT